MDEYVMPIADMLVDAATNNGKLTFIDGYSGYNQIYLAEEDIHKIAFHCPRSIRILEWVVMPFGLKNTGATCQRAMNLIFRDLTGKNMEVYIDDVVVKSANFLQHLPNLEQYFIRMQQHSLKMNPTKCAFGVSDGNFLDFLVHNQGIVVDKNKTKVVLEARSPRNKKELQSLIDKVNFLKRLLANSTGKRKAYSPLLRLKVAEDCIWGEEQQKAFNQIKECLANPLVLTPPAFGRLLKLYILTTNDSIDSLLAQDAEDGTERVVYYLSWLLKDAKEVHTNWKIVSVFIPCLY